jgi:hypothetical protein
MEGTYVGWAVLAASFFIGLCVLMAKESKALRRHESARDPLFRPEHAGADKRSL